MKAPESAPTAPTIKRPVDPMGFPLRTRLFLWIQKRRRDRVRARYRTLFDAVTALLFQHDPVGLNFEDNTDEYDAEAGTIIPRLPRCRSEADVLKVVYEEFTRWFTADVVKPGPRYEAAARGIWALYHQDSVAPPDRGVPS